MQRVIIGTAGHVDHGKSTLVKTLTGIDPDRLPEEKERGMTIDLGFVFLPVGNDEEVAIIDMPGHERFVKTMIAGATSIRLVLFVVAADEGVMAQTREHLQILELLGLAQGIVVVTKVDKVSEEELDLAVEDARSLIRGSFLETAPLIRVSAVTGQGIEELRQMIRNAVRALPPLPCTGVFRTPIDRVFSIRGFGTIVAGTVISGRLKKTEMVEILPLKKTSRLRGLQVHSRPVEEVFTGQRVAFNLVDVGTSELGKGFELSSPAYFEPTSSAYVEVELLNSPSRPLTSGTRVRLHKGTCEVMARVTVLDQEKIKPGTKGLAMLRFESPIIAARNERCLLRTYSPMILIGRGKILESHPDQYRRGRSNAIEFLNSLRGSDIGIEQIIRFRTFPLHDEKEIMRAVNLTADEAASVIKDLIARKVILRLKNGAMVHKDSYLEVRNEFIKNLCALHDRMPTTRYIPFVSIARSLPKAVPGLAEHIAADIVEAGIAERRENGLRLIDHPVTLPAGFQDLMRRIADRIEGLGCRAFTIEKLTASISDYPHESVRSACRYLCDTGRLVEIDAGSYMSQSTLDVAEDVLRRYLRTRSEIRATDFKDLLGVPRDVARSILDHFLRKGITVRKLGTHRLAGQPD